MKSNVKKSKVIIMTMLMILAVPVSVYASTTKSANLYADYARAKGVLTCSFHWKIADKDSADAYTEIPQQIIGLQCGLKLGKQAINALDTFIKIIKTKR